ncbi:hypothetical protein EG329_007212 [Mollisiaceae sp. DMI_Dod_QoI]|nr:hypothetical protein EG329_007212 [Helotiales sp. DMI_Dod_QoI]
MVFRTLSLVAADLSVGFLTLNGLSDLLAVNLENPSFDRRNRPLDLYAPAEACTCLLTYDVKNRKLILAHYTVKEFLLSSRIRSGPANFFQMTDDSILFLVASCFIVYLLYEDYNNPNESLMQLAKEWHIYVNWLFSSITSGCKKPAILANLCLFEQIEVAEIFLASETEPICFETLLIWDAHPEIEEFLCLTKDGEDDALLEDDVTLELGNLLTSGTRFFEFFISKGADVNTVSPTGFSLLATVLNPHFRIPGTYSNSWWNRRSQLVEILLAHKADPSKAECTITPLQSLIEGIDDERFEYEDYVPYIRGILRKLLDTGARVNGVGCDATNVKRIRTTAHLYFQKSTSQLLCLDPEKEGDVITVALHNRGHSLFYDTPLRILENKKEHWIEQRRYSAYPLERLKSLEKVEELLKSYGAKSLHLFPIKDLPGYDEDDMEEWQKLNESQDMTVASSSTSGP